MNPLAPAFLLSLLVLTAAPALALKVDAAVEVEKPVVYLGKPGSQPEASVYGGRVAVRVGEAVAAFEDPLLGVSGKGATFRVGTGAVDAGHANASFEDPLLGIWGTGNVGLVVGTAGAAFEDPLLGIWGTGNVGRHGAHVAFEDPLLGIWGTGNVGYEGVTFKHGSPVLP